MFAFDLDTAEIYIYDDIGPAWLGMIEAGDVMAALKELGDQRVTVRINSPGGSVDEGVAIYNALKRHGAGVDTIVDSLAASMGSYIFMAGENRKIAKNGKVMVHHPWTIAAGNSKDLRETADVLDKYSASLIPDYAAGTGKTAEEITAIMEAETWYTSEEAVVNGFAHALDDADAVEPVKVAAGRFRNTPQDLLNPIAAGSRTPYPAKRERARMLLK